MTRLILCGVIAALLLRGQRAWASADSIGPNGINSSGLMLTGSGVDIGQVERRRPGDPEIGKDEAEAIVNTTVDPEQVFYRQTNGGFAPNYNLGNEVEDHAVQVAGVMISTDALAQGVAQEADLFSIGVNQIGTDFEVGYGQVAESINHLATLSGQDSSGQNIDIRAINLSFGIGGPVSPGIADGTNTFTSYIDWSARTHDILYVVAVSEATTPYGIPDDNFNGIDVVYSEKNGAKYRQVAAGNVLTPDDTPDNGERTFPDIMAPGNNILLASTNDTFPTSSGTSFAVPHVTGTVALLQQHATTQIANVGGPRWSDPNARRHEVMKAVIMNSADKIEQGSITEHNGLEIPAGGLLGMERTAWDKMGNDWFSSEADDDTADVEAPRNGGVVPLDDEMGVGHLNANRALMQFSTGEFNDSNTVDVPVMGWDYGFTSGEADINRYRFEEQLNGGSFVSISLAWDRVVNLSPGDGATYEAGDTFTSYKDTDGGGDLPGDSQINDLDIFFQERGAPSINSAIATSSSQEGNIEHLFFQVPSTGLYEFWVRQHDDDIDGIQNYGVAWWASSATIVDNDGDFNNDGMIDSADLAQWRGDFGVDDGSDADGDGDSDGNDFLVWQRTLGATSATASGIAVPEPASLLFCAFAVPWLVGRRTINRH